MDSSSTKCKACDAQVDPTSDRCLTCGADIGAPNVRAATTPAEVSALRTRYDDAVHRATARGALDTLRAFEKALAGSASVVNCNLSFLKEFVTQDKTLFANYRQMVQAGTRKAATPERDQERSVVDAIMFRSYAPFIRFGALSVNNRGVASYGPYSLRLRDIAVARRSSILEENSFAFVAHHNLGPKTPIPAGFRSEWTARGLIAVAKLGDLIDVGPQKGGFSELLLKSNGDFDTDQFVEVHIFGTFYFNAVECVCGPVPKKAVDVAIWDFVKETVTRSGKRIEEW